MAFKRSQAALEFLTTYSWAFLVIMLTIGALYYFGVFDFNNYLPEKCMFTPQFECKEFVLLEEEAEVRLRISNQLGEDLRITGWDITNDAEDPLTCDSPSAQDFDKEDTIDVVFDNCAGGAFIKGERQNIKITMTYYAKSTPSQPVHTVKGRIVGVVS